MAKKKKKKLTNRQRILWLLFGVTVAVLACCILLSAFERDPMEELAVGALGFLTGSFAIYMGVDAVDHASANRRDVALAKLNRDTTADADGDE